MHQAGKINTKMMWKNVSKFITSDGTANSNMAAHMMRENVSPLVEGKFIKCQLFIYLFFTFLVNFYVNINLELCVINVFK